MITAIFKRNKLALEMFRAHKKMRESPKSDFVMTAYIKLRQGAIITCPECGANLLKAKRDLSSLDKIRMVDFEKMLSICCAASLHAKPSKEARI